MKTTFAGPLRRSPLILALAATVLAGCGGHGGGNDNGGGTNTDARPIISSQPSSVSGVLGGTASFTVASSNASNYQWYKNGNIIHDGTGIAGTSSATLTLSSLTSANTGTYFCVVSNDNGSTNTSTVTLAIVAATAPSVTAAPSNLAVQLGGSGTFRVTAAGASPLSYQWFKDGTAIVGATSSTYTVSPVTAASVGSYFVRVTNPYGTVDSDAASLSIASASSPTITNQPDSLTVNLGARATFTVAATGTGTLTYQWYKGTIRIAGATSATYTIPAVTASDTGDYSVAVTNASGTTTSNAASLTVISPPAIATQPQSKTVFLGQSVTFTAVATGGNLTYAWYKDVGSTPVSTGPTLTIARASGTDAGSYRLVVSNSAGSATSNTVTLTVLGPPTISVQPVSVSVGAGNTATFTVGATGTSLTFQWYRGRRPDLRRHGHVVHHGGDEHRRQRGDLLLRGLEPRRLRAEQTPPP